MERRFTMKAVGFMGSPRIGGNTDLLLDACLKGAEASGALSEKIRVYDLKIAPCREFYGCLKDGDCVIQDDMQEVYGKLLGTDIVILASPMFFYGIPGQLKSLIDRCQALWARRSILNQPPPGNGRKGAFLAVGATRGKKLFDGPILTIKYLFKEIGVAYTGQLLVRGIDAKGEITNHPTAISEAHELGRRLAGD
jgi:multimeric flavodoxin WrbA